jgi:hypothetical protein
VLDGHGNALNLVPVLQRVGGLPYLQRMRDRGTEFKDYLVETDARDGVATGLMARIRLHNWPDRVNFETGALDRLLLPQAELIAEEMNFLYDARLRVLATQRQRYFRASVLMELLCEVADEPMSAQPILKRAAWQRFRRLQRIGSLEMRIDGPLHHPDFDETMPALGQMLDEAGQAANAISVELKLSMGHVRNRSLTRDVVRGLVDRLRGANNVSKLVATGLAHNEERSEIIDFIRDRLVFSGEVEYTPNGRHLDRGQCQQLLRASIAEQRRHLEGR